MRSLIVLLIVLSGCRSVSKVQTKTVEEEKLVFKGEIKNLYSMDRGFFSFEDSQERVIKTPVVLTVNGVEVVAHQEEVIRAVKKTEEVNETIDKSEEAFIEVDQSKKSEQTHKTVEKVPVPIPIGNIVLLLLILGVTFVTLKKLRIL